MSLRNPNRNDVAREAAVSGATVSRVLSGRADIVSRETRERVLVAAERIGYRVNHSARALVTGRSNLVALWLPRIQTSFHAQIAYHTSIVQRPAGYRVVITDTSVGAAQGAAHADDVTVDGIIAQGGGRAVRAALERRRGLRPPIVMTGFNTESAVDFASVDLRAGEEEAVRHLYASGCRRIAMLINAGSNAPREPRVAGYLHALNEAGLAPEFIETDDDDQSRAGAVQAVRAHVERSGHPDAIVALNDDMAIGANRALRELGRRVPDDVCLVGCDGIEDTEYQEPRLTTIVQPISEMARLAWRYLLERIEEPDRPLQQTVLRPRLAIRESSRR